MAQYVKDSTEGCVGVKAMLLWESLQWQVNKEK